MNQGLLLAALALCLLAASAPAVAADAAAGTAPECLERPAGPAGPAFAVTDPRDITSVAEIHELLRAALLPEAPQQAILPARELLDRLESCRLTGQPEITVSREGASFAILDATHRVTVSDPRFTAPLARLLERLGLHLPGAEGTAAIASGSFVLAGPAVSRVELLLADGTRRFSVARDLGHPFSGEGAEALSVPRNHASPAPKARTLLGYYVGNPSGASHATLLAHGDRLDYISPAWYWLDPDKPGHFQKDPNFGAFTDDQVREVVAAARRKGAKVLVLFHNMTAGGVTAAKDLLHRVLTEPAIRDACLADIVSLVRAFDFDGVNMDFESLHLKDKAAYAEFMLLLKARLAPLGKLTTIAVPAKFSDADNSWNGPFDYAKMGQACDFVMVMTYDENGSWSKPGPVASLPWVEKALQYAVSRIPPAKVVMGFPTYGRDWTSDGKCKSISCLNAELLIKNQNLTPKWDAYLATPSLEYTDAAGVKHTIWYENRESLGMKFKLLDKYGLHGAGMWRLGMEAADFWTHVAR